MTVWKSGIVTVPMPFSRFFDDLGLDHSETSAPDYASGVAGESKTEAVRRALRERIARL
jgi:hypothetical protein